MIRMSVGHILIVLLGVMATTPQWPFQSYPAVVSKQKPVPVKLETPKAKLYRTAIRKAVRRGPNFAGHYTVAGWQLALPVAPRQRERPLVRFKPL
jgi:hypothetical protein